MNTETQPVSPAVRISTMLAKEYGDVRPIKAKNYQQYEAFLRNPTQERYNFKPIRAGIYITRLCNLSCPNCTYNENYFFKKGKFVEPDDMAKIIKAIGPYAKSFFLAGGEPMINPHFMCFVKMVNAIPGCTVSISTNGLFLGKYMEEILDAHISYLNISLDAVDDLGFQRERFGKPGEFEQIMGYIREIARRRDLKKLPHLCISFVVHKANMHEMDAMIKLGEDLGVDNIVFHNLNNHAIPELISLRKDDPEVIAFMERFLKRKDYKVNFILPGLVVDEPTLCFTTFKDMYVNEEGMMSPCCHIMDFTYSEFTGDLDKDWNNDKLREHRQAFIDGKLPHINCQNCHRRFEPYARFSKKYGWVKDSWTIRKIKALLKRFPKVYDFLKVTRVGATQPADDGLSGALELVEAAQEQSS